MTPTPITDAAQTILTRLDTAYAGIEPDDIDAMTAIWFEILKGEEAAMRLNRHDDELTRYREAIEIDTFLMNHYRTLERLATKPAEQAIYRTSAESRERMIATHEAKVKELEAVTRGQQAA